MYYRQAEVAIIVFDITLPESLEAAKYWIGELQSNMAGSIRHVYLVGNKVDLVKIRRITARQAKVRSH